MSLKRASRLPVERWIWGRGMGWRNTHKLAKAGGRETAPPTPQPPPELALLSVVREWVWRSHRGLPTWV